MTVPERCSPVLIVEIEAFETVRSVHEENKALYLQQDRRSFFLHERCKNDNAHSKLVPCCRRELPDCCRPALPYHAGAENHSDFNSKLLEVSMHVPLLHLWRKFFL